MQNRGLAFKVLQLATKAAFGGRKFIIYLKIGSFPGVHICNQQFVSLFSGGSGRGRSTGSGRGSSTGSGRSSGGSGRSSASLSQQQTPDSSHDAQVCRFPWQSLRNFTTLINFDSYFKAF